MTRAVNEQTEDPPARRAGWSHNWQNRWSHEPGRKPPTAVPCSWQATLGAKPSINPLSGNGDKPVTEADSGSSGGPGEVESGSGRRGRRSTGRSRGSSDPSMDDDLNIHPSGVESLKDFISRSGPKNQNEKVLAIVYWLHQIAKAEKVGHDQIFTAFRLTGEKVPASLGNKVSQTGSKGWLKETKSNNVTLSVAGINHMEHEMLKRQKSD